MVRTAEDEYCVGVARRIDLRPHIYRQSRNHGDDQKETDRYEHASKATTAACRVHGFEELLAEPNCRVYEVHKGVTVRPVQPIRTLSRGLVCNTEALRFFATLLYYSSPAGPDRVDNACDVIVRQREMDR